MTATAEPVADNLSPRQQAVERAREGWIRRLYDVSRRNNLLYFRELKMGTLDFTGADTPSMHDLLAGKSVSLARLLPPKADLAAGAWRVRQIRRRALENLEERGLNTLFIALGMASWTPGDDGKPAAAAVLLVPVTVEAKGRESQSLTLLRAGDVQVNLVLLHVLETEFGCTVTPEQLLENGGPEEDLPVDPEMVFARLRAVANEVPGFDILSRTVLGNFAFQKMAMVKDLQERAAEMADHDLIAAVAGDVEAREIIRGAGYATDFNELDHIAPQSEFLVFDADSSQQRVIYSVLDGQSGVVQGPPGTGKSQTIANLLAALAAEGKRVLFVAEKRAALEVVLQRLQRAGLGYLALDLHGADISRRAVMARLASALSQIKESTDIEDGPVHTKFLDRRDRLNAHVERLHRKRAPSGMSVYAMLGRLLRMPAGAQATARWRSDDLIPLDGENAETLHDLFTEAGGFGDLFLRTDPSPWTNALLEDGAATQQAIDLAARLQRERWPAFQTALTNATTAAEITSPKTLRDAEALINLLDGLVAQGARYSADLFAHDVATLARALTPASKGMVGSTLAGFLNSAYRDALATVRALRTAGPVPPAQLYTEIAEVACLAKDWSKLTQSAISETVSSSNPRIPQSAILDILKQRWETLQLDLQALAAVLPDVDVMTLPLEDCGVLLEGLATDAVTPHRLPRLRAIEAELADRGAAEMVVELRRTRPAPEWWPQQFAYAWLASCLDAARVEDPEIGGFHGQTHAQFVREFCDLDQQRLQLAVARVKHHHAEHAVDAMNQHPEQEALVRREAEKRSRLLPLRTLLAQAPEVLTALCPCWMASPLSVSQLLDADRRYFDVVIFDEASQVLPEDAMPALLRASQAVVAGDRCQLPPTTFFSSGEEESDESAEATATEGFESFLDLLSPCLETWQLEWHYRSRDEALIAFSNRNIYENRLVTFPGIGGSAAIRHEQVPPGLPGEDESSAAELARVVALVLEHAHTHPGETLGVIALGIRHATRIQDALDDALALHPELDGFFRQDRPERFFVKNLERVQGDERDAIILSIGYGKTRGGKLLYHFGPLLTEGGERRLNVAITRARTRLTLVSSFTHLDMNPNRTAARGVDLLRAYLEFAAGGGTLADPSRTAGEPVDDFQADVYQALSEVGIPLRAQWGMSKCRIDFAAAHPTRPERFVLALECDGENYRATHTARERDRLRRQQLENLGWHYHRIWALDWNQRRAEEIARALDAYHEAVAYANIRDNGVTTPTPPTEQPAAEDEATPERATRPAITPGQKIDDYTAHDLLEIARWLNSDGLLRTDEEIIEEMMTDLNLSRRTERVEEALREAIAAWREESG
ncbi:MAG: AAA domain-containing protein [Armatimonadota bacterium]